MPFPNVIPRLLAPTSSQNIATTPATKEIQPTARCMRVARAGWHVGALIAWGILILSVTAQTSTIAAEAQRNLAAQTSSWLTAGANIAGLFAQTAASLISLVLAALLYRKRPDEGLVLLTSYFFLVNGVVMVPLTFLEPFLPGAQRFTYSVIQPIFFAPLLIAFLSVFPNGRFVPTWTRSLVAAAILYAPVGTFVFTARPNAEPRLIFTAAVLFWFALIFTGLYAQVVRYRHVSNAIERQQTKWVVFGFAMAAFLASLMTIWTFAFDALWPDTSLPWWAPLLNMGWSLAYVALPISLTFAVMRYRLFDIDIIINRTLVYGTLTASTMALYVFIVGFLGNQIQSEDRSLIAFLTTGVLAVLFQPLRQRLQRAVNQFMYGERDEPFDVLARMGKRLQSTLAPEMVYPTIVETVAQTFKLPYAAIAVKRGEQFEIAEEYGSRIQEPVAFPLAHQGEVIGRLLVGRRSGEESFSAADERLLRSIARQAGTAVYAVRLTADLQRSRQQLVTAREEERLRLRRDLHDGLGPELASVVWQMESVHDMIQSEPDEAVQLLKSSIEQAQATLVGIRRLVYGLRPPALDELGLVGALEQATRHYLQTTVTIETVVPLPSLPAAVEVAAYRIVQEALKNAVTHGKAQRCLVRLAVLDGSLHLAITDDGLGMAEVVTPGVGLVSMRQRAEELGGAFKIGRRQRGGTEVQAWLPLA